MKKVLFATTALVVTAGIAAADVSLSGRAEMGVNGGNNGGTAPTDVNTGFFTDIDVTFTLSGETDGGITFGAAIDIDESTVADTAAGGSTNGAFGNNADDGGIAIFISGDFGTLTMGDTDGALDFAMQEAAAGNAGSLADDETAHAGYLGSYGDGAYDGQILRYDYSFDQFTFAVSVEMDDATAGTRDTGYAVGATYTFSFSGGSATVGGGVQFIDAANYNPGNTANYTGQDLDGEYMIIGVSAAVSLDNGLSAAIAYTDYSSEEATPDDEYTHIGVGAGYTFDAITVSANYGMWDITPDGGAPAEEISGFGFAAAYDFGGGLSAHLGYGMSETDAAGANASYAESTWSFGLAMSF
ncbi:MAG: porin [Gymnodinialimonas sp.]